MTRTRTPKADPLGLQLTKQYLRVDHSIEDDLINLQIEVSGKFVEDYCQRDLLPSTYSEQSDSFDQDSFPDSYTLIDVYSPTSINVSYLDASQLPVVIDPADYTTDYNDRYKLLTITFETKPTLTADSALVVAWDQESEYAVTISQARLLMLAGWYENREELVAGTLDSSAIGATKAILGPYMRLDGLDLTSRSLI